MSLKEPVFHGSVCNRNFFPQRVALKIDGRSFSPTVIAKARYFAGTLPAYHLASESLLKLSDISITGRHIGNLSESIGKAYFDQTLPRVQTEPSTPIPLAVVSVDGGRMQTRASGGPNGVQDPQWGETKNAMFMRMSGVSEEIAFWSGR